MDTELQERFNKLEEEHNMYLTKEHRQKVLSKLGEVWAKTPEKSFMEVMLEHLPEEDIFWTSDEHLLLRLDGIDPYAEEELDDEV